MVRIQGRPPWSVIGVPALLALGVPTTSASAGAFHAPVDTGTNGIGWLIGWGLAITMAALFAWAVWSGADRAEPRDDARASSLRPRSPRRAGVPAGRWTEVHRWSDERLLEALERRPSRLEADPAPEVVFRQLLEDEASRRVAERGPKAAQEPGREAGPGPEIPAVRPRQDR